MILTGASYSLNSPLCAALDAGEIRRDRAVAELASWALWLLCTLVVVFGSGAVVSLLFVDIYNPGVDVPAARYAWLPVYGLAVALLALRLSHGVRLATYSPFIIVCVFIAGVSFLWSYDPALTLRRSVALALTTTMGLALASWLSWARLIQAVAVAFLLLALLSFAVALADPLRGIMSEIFPGAWRGPFMQKNELGGMMTKGLIAALGALAIRPRRWWLWVPTGLLCLALVLLSTSKTALLISCGSLALFGWMYAYRGLAVLRPVLVFALIGGAGGLGLAVALFPAEVLGLIGKDPTFTGRTDIWREMAIAIQERPWFGYGYGAFWDDELGPSYNARTALEWPVPSAHNGWVETLLGGGALLLGAFAAHCLFVLGALVASLRRGGRECYWVVLSTVAFFGFSMSESAVLQQNDLTWILFVAATTKLLAGERAPHPKARRGAARERAYAAQHIPQLRPALPDFAMPELATVIPPPFRSPGRVSVG